MVSVASNHFLTHQNPKRSIATMDHPTYKDNLTWAELSSLPATSSSHKTLSTTLSTTSPFMKAFNSRLSQDNWGSWAVPHALAPTDAMQSRDTENLAWEHPTTTTLSLVLDGVEYEAALTQNTKFIAASYTSQEQVWINGTRYTDQEAPARTREDVVNCYYDGHLRPVNHIPFNHNTASASTGNQTQTLRTASVTGARNVNTVSFASGARTTAPIIKDTLVSINTCSGGFDGIIRTPKRTYVITPALNHLSALTIAQTMASLETQSIRVPLGSLHLVYNLDEDYDRTGLGGCGLDVHNHTASAFINAQANAHAHHHGHHHAHHDHAHTHSHDSFADLTHEHPTIQALALTDSDNILKMKGRKMSVQANTRVYVEWLLVSDKRRYDAFGANVESDMLKIAHFVSAYYEHNNVATDASKFSIPVSVVLVAHVAFTIADPYEASVPVGTCSTCGPQEVSSATLLSAFSNWRASNNAPLHDNGHLLSGHDFDGYVLGLAYLGTQCVRQSAGGIDQTTLSYSPEFNSIVVAHELGHNFNMHHDSVGNSCSAGVNIMSASLNPSADTSDTSSWTRFSTCSATYFNDYVANFDLTCLYNEPTTAYGDRSCGDGLLQPGEECDCGGPDCSSSDPCCDGTKCLLKSFVTFDGTTYAPKCSSRQACCTSKCLIEPPTHKCRPSQGQCDLDEFCDGENANCPRDVMLGSGHSCINTLGMKGNCYLGGCNSFDASCRELGIKYKGVDTYRGCPDQAKLNKGNFCGYQYCLPSPGAASCETFLVGGVATPMSDGVYCGLGSQCYAGNCVSMSSLSSDYIWATAEWSQCDQCGSLQLRAATCTNAQSKVATSAIDMCVPQEGMPALTQRCDNVTLGCVYDFSPSEMSSSNMYLFGKTVPIIIVIYVAMGIVLFYFLVIATCYRSITTPVKGIKNMQDREQENPDLRDDDD